MSIFFVVIKEYIEMLIFKELMCIIPNFMLKKLFFIILWYNDFFVLKNLILDFEFKFQYNKIHTVIY